MCKAFRPEQGNRTHENGTLRQVQLPGGVTLDYLIDPANRRIGIKRNGILTKGLLYQDSLRPIAELDGQGKIVSLGGV